MQLPGQCRFIDFQDFSNASGNMAVIEKVVPFEIKRLYYLYNQNNTEVRGRHAHIDLEQIIFAIHGSFELIVDDGTHKQSLLINNPKQGVYISPMIWRDLINFTPDAVCLVLASDFYKEEDYIRDYTEFKQRVAHGA